MTPDNEGTYVREYAQESMYNYLHLYPKYSPDWLMINLLYLLSIFGKPSQEEQDNDIYKSKHIGDTTLFEMWCYLYLLLDMWLYQNSTYPRDKFFNIYSNFSENIFNNALKIDNTIEILESRINGYATVLHETKDNVELIKHLKKLIQLSSEESEPANYDFQKSRVPYSDFMDSINLEKDLSSWHEAIIPETIEAVRLYAENNT